MLMSPSLLIIDKDLNAAEFCLSESEVDPEKRNLQVILIMLPWVKREEDPDYDEDKKD